MKIKFFINFPIQKDSHLLIKLYKLHKLFSEIILDPVVSKEESFDECQVSE